ncbi:MAG: molybdopterin-guanine dinucleotide biosynthesis protein B [Spirochaetae bacterium HGW-Spirochaetae-7]|jgi:molybdopterin-guanine dinucleotide biosynthesis protein MobB|nr:MAG: molybdopterin-guanine dinucleotide biosynthesis protein B [Spirochaetae bacterium HGW-Spirochaetae-7]
MGTKIACFIGWSNTGKTGFIEACAAALQRHGLRVGAVKCVHHGASFNPRGKDSSRFFDAGAEAALVSDAETVRVTRTPPSWDRSFVEALFPSADVILIEGRVVPGALRVILGGSAEDEAGLKRPLDDFDVLVTGFSGLAGRALAAGKAVYNPEDSGSFVESHLLGGNAMKARDVSVTNNGIDVPLNAFVMETIENVVLGLVKPLKKTDLDGEIVIRIGPALK